MRKNVRFTGFLILIFAILIGCEAAMKQEQKRNEEAVQQALAIGTEYFKSKYDVEAEWTDHQFQPEYASNNVALYGHVKDNPDKKIYILINYKTFEVVSSVHPNEEHAEQK